MLTCHTCVQCHTLLSEHRLAIYILLIKTISNLIEDHTIPKNVVTAVLVQESGRAGRDGEHSMSILYASPADIEWCTKICKAHERPKVCFC